MNRIKTSDIVDLFHRGSLKYVTKEDILEELRFLLFEDKKGGSQ